MAKRKCLEWGFDFTDFGSGKEWKQFLKRHKCKLVGTKDLGYGAYKTYGHKPDAYMYKCNGVGITTTHPGKKTPKRPDFDGFLGYVGVEFTEKAKPKWKKMRKDFVKSAEYIKEETRCDAQFIAPPSVIKKQKKWIPS